jgi:hypothetical protein
VISQFWGEAYFHANIENIPRLALHLDFLIENPQIYIHVRKPVRVSPMFQTLGLVPSRIVSGDVKSGLIYLPQGGGCGNPVPPGNVQIIASHYRNFIEREFRDSVPAQNSLILIQRKGTRRLSQHHEVAMFLEEMTVNNGLHFQVFSDNPFPSFNDTMKLFYSAVLVVAPHGAGLANMIFSQPGTYVVEVLCHPTNDNGNLCYSHLDYKLGHHHHGFVGMSGCQIGITIDILSFEATLREILAGIFHHWRPP